MAQYVVWVPCSSGNLRGASLLALEARGYPSSVGRAGKGVPVPEHPYPGQKWKEVRHDNTVTWLAFWKDPISQKDYKYVWLAANSLFKSDSDLAKYEKARKLKARPVATVCS